MPFLENASDELHTMAFGNFFEIIPILMPYSQLIQELNSVLKTLFLSTAINSFSFVPVIMESTRDPFPLSAIDSNGVKLSFGDLSLFY
jgi:Mg2+/citrate symporter